MTNENESALENKYRVLREYIIETSGRKPVSQNTPHRLYDEINPLRDFLLNEPIRKER